jgi:hypothetical protein
LSGATHAVDCLSSKSRERLQFSEGETSMRPLEFGWYLPTHSDTTAYGPVEAQVAGSP